MINDHLGLGIRVYWLERRNEKRLCAGEGERTLTLPPSQSRSLSKAICSGNLTHVKQAICSRSVKRGNRFQLSALVDDQDSVHTLQ